MIVRRQPLGCKKENPLTKKSLLWSRHERASARLLTHTTCDSCVIAIIDGLIDTKTDYHQPELNCFWGRQQILLYILYLVYFSLNFFEN